MEHTEGRHKRRHTEGIDRGHTKGKNKRGTQNWHIKETHGSDTRRETHAEGRHTWREDMKDPQGGDIQREYTDRTHKEYTRKGQTKGIHEEDTRWGHMKRTYEGDI